MRLSKKKVIFVAKKNNLHYGHIHRQGQHCHPTIYIDWNKFSQLDNQSVVDEAQKLLSGEAITIDDGCFRYYLSEIQCCDSVLAVLVTLGLLTYDYETYRA